MRNSRAENARVVGQKEVADAEADYQRFRAAYVQIARDEPGHEVALAMIGADMDRAYARLQQLMQQPSTPFTHQPVFVTSEQGDELLEESA